MTTPSIILPSWLCVQARPLYCCVSAMLLLSSAPDWLRQNASQCIRNASTLESQCPAQTLTATATTTTVPPVALQVGGLTCGVLTQGPVAADQPEWHSALRGLRDFRCVERSGGRLLHLWGVKWATYQRLAVPAAGQAVRVRNLPGCAQANAWQSFSGGSVPGDGVAYRHHVAVWSDAADGFYTFGGYGGSRETI